MYNENLDIIYTEEELHDELFYFAENEGNFSLNCYKNKIVKFFQQDEFYKVEKMLFKNASIRAKLIENRKKYLSKKEEDLTTEELLRGFKISGIHYGYSGFNPLLATWFYNKYKTKICYDPFGGWGHRLLGSLNLDKYIYNDLSTTTYMNVKNIIEYFDIANTECYNEDAKTFIPQCDFDTIFTCPPYYNLEKYECGIFNTKEDYNELLKSIIDLFYKTDSCKVIGIVNREDLMPDIKYTEILSFDTKKSHFNKTKNNKEKLFIIDKLL